MEVVGLVVGVLPLVMAAFQCYEKAQTFTSKIRRKNSLFRSLRRAISGYATALEYNVDWLLRFIGAYEQFEITDRAALLEKPWTGRQIQTFLGDVGAEAFWGAILEVFEALEVILKSIDGFVVGNIKGESPALKNIRFDSASGVKIRYRDGFKLALSSKQIKYCITKADNATQTMDRIRSAKSDIQWIEDKIKNESPIKDRTRALVQIRDYARHLHQAISSHWAKDCYSFHETNLHLEDRIEARPRKLKASKSLPIQFRVRFVSKKATVRNTSVVRESLIEVLWRDADDELDELDEPLALRHREGRLVIPSPELTRQNPQSSIITSICMEVCKTGKVQTKDILCLSVQPQCTMRYQASTPATPDTNGLSTETVTLADLLKLTSNEISRVRLFPRACVELALVLASTVLQLSETPWLYELWTKENIRFVKINPSTSMRELQSRDIDITKPLAITAFGRSSTVVNTQKLKGRQPTPAQPKKVMLELSILMLELWHETSIEVRFADRINQVEGDDLDRKHLAERWLEEDRDLLGFQSDAVGNCLRYLHTYGPNRSLEWTDEEFLQSFATGVVEPLYRESNKGRG